MSYAHGVKRPKPWNGLISVRRAAERKDSVVVGPGGQSIPGVQNTLSAANELESGAHWR